MCLGPDVAPNGQRHLWTCRLPPHGALNGQAKDILNGAGRKKGDGLAKMCSRALGKQACRQRAQLKGRRVWSMQIASYIQTRPWPIILLRPQSDTELQTE
jgi:hypothetical protein